MDDFKNSLLALSGSLPVLAPLGFGFEEIVKDRVSGMFYEKHNSEILADKVLAIYKSRNIKNLSQEFFNKELRNNFKEEVLVNNLRNILIS